MGSPLRNAQRAGSEMSASLSPQINKVGAVSRGAVARFLVDQAEQAGYQHLKPALSARA